MIVHEPHDADRPRLNIQELQHLLRSREGKTGGIDLLRDLLRLERLVPRHHQQIEIRFLPVAEEQVFADHDAQDLVDLKTEFHGISRLMVRPLVRDPQTVQPVVDPHFPRETARHVRRTSVK